MLFSTYLFTIEDDGHDFCENLVHFLIWITKYWYKQQVATTT